MPLKEGSSRETISDNISTEIHHGKKPAVAKAIAYRKARESGAQIPKPKKKRKTPAQKMFLG